MMTVDELLPSITPLPHAEKIRLVRVVLQQIVQEETKLAPPMQAATERLVSQRCSGVALRSAWHNPLKGSVTFEKDILSPVGDEWDADQ